MRLILLLFVLAFFGCYKTERYCKSFQTGSFYGEVVINGTVYKSTFERNDSMQVEIYRGKIHASHVRWINDCEAIFKTINPKNMAEQKDIHLKILTTTDSSYTYEYSYVGETRKQKGIAYKATKP